jgi:hypothetical protein
MATAADRQVKAPNANRAERADFFRLDSPKREEG